MLFLVRYHPTLNLLLLLAASLFLLIFLPLRPQLTILGHLHIQNNSQSLKPKNQKKDMDPAPLVLGADPPSRLENELVAAAVPALGAAARTRANAVFYGFCALSVGFIITMAALV